MPTEQEQVLRRIVLEGFGGELDVIDRLVADGVSEHQYGLPADRQGLKRAITVLRRAFPDLSYTVIDTPYDGEKVWGHFRARGTNLGPFMGREPTGRTIEIDVIDIVRIENGRVVEHWGVPDRFALLNQLGPLDPANAGERARVPSAGSTRPLV
jgi:predicted ester cyclase